MPRTSIDLPMPPRPVAESSVSTGPLLVLSPHYDDAVLSCAALLDRPEPVDVITVFGGDPDPPQQGWWDRSCGFENSAESLPARRREDEAAFASSEHRTRALPFLEAQYVHGPRPELERAAIGEVIAEWSTRHPAGTVAVPAGAGRTLSRVTRHLAVRLPGLFGFIKHGDHLFVRDAALARLRGENACTPLLYEELPYLWTRPADAEVAAAAAAWGFKAEPLFLAVNRQAKARRISAYRSQLSALSSGASRPGDPASLPGKERYWRLVWSQP